MKIYEKLLNALNKVQIVTLQERIVKEDGLRAMIQTIKEAGYVIQYIPGKGYKVKTLA